MYKKMELNNSYLSIREFIYHGAIIGLGIGTLEMLYKWLFIFSSSNIETDTGETLFALVLTALIIPFTTAIFAVASALLTYPVYSYWAKRKGGLQLILQTKTVNNETL